MRISVVWTCAVWLVVVAWVRGASSSAGDGFVHKDQDYLDSIVDHPEEHTYHSDDYFFDEETYAVFLPNLTNITFQKCRCHGYQVWTGEVCQNASTLVVLFEPVSGKRVGAFTNDLGEVSLNLLTCPDDHRSVFLNSNDGAEFYLLESGDLYWEQQVFTKEFYCVDHILDLDGQPTAWEAQVCLPPPSLPLCCPPGHILLHNGNCMLSSTASAITPPVTVRDTKVMWTDLSNNSEIVHITCNGSRNEVYHPKVEGDVRLLWHFHRPFLHWTPPSVQELPEQSHNYCLGDDESGGTVARLCYKDKVLEHHQICKNATCVRKCCPGHHIFGQSCTFVSNKSVVWHPKFYKLGSLVPASAPSDLVIIKGYPLCKSFTRLDAHEPYYLLDDGSLHIPKVSLRIPNIYGQFQADSYCLENYSLNNSMHALALVCYDKDTCQSVIELVYPTFFVLSCMFLVITLLVCVTVPELHAEVSGKCLVSHVIAFLLAYISLIVVKYTTGSLTNVTCKIVATITQFSFLAAFFWLNVMCFDIWWIYYLFGKMRSEQVELHTQFKKLCLNYTPEKLDQFLRRLCYQPRQEVDNFVSGELTKRLFEIEKMPFRMDTQQGRDHTIASDNNLRQVCGLPRVENFRDLLDILPEEMNQLSHHLDDSNIYGSNREEEQQLRTFRGGLLNVQECNLRPLDSQAMECASIRECFPCFRTGDNRVNEQVELSVIHTLWARFHNFIASALARQNPMWSDETLFQEARRKVVAIYQYIIFNEWLPIIIGKEYMTDMQILSLRQGFSNNSDSSANPTITNTLVQGMLESIVAAKGVRSRFRFIKYSLYAWGCPTLITVAGITIQSLPEHYDVIRPDFDMSRCWFVNTNSKWIYFNGFVLILVISNIVFFCWVAYILNLVQNGQCLLNIEYKYLYRRNSKDPFLRCIRQQNRERMWLYLRLFLVMGVTWIFEVVSWHEGSCWKWIITDIINSLQGFFIFLIFLCKRNMIKKIRTNWDPYLRRVKKLFCKTPPPPSVHPEEGTRNEGEETDQGDEPGGGGLQMKKIIDDREKREEYEQGVIESENLGKEHETVEITGDQLKKEQMQRYINNDLLRKEQEQGEIDIEQQIKEQD